jgi:hypothetical protein
VEGADLAQALDENAGVFVDEDAHELSQGFSLIGQGKEEKDIRPG